MKKTKSLPEKIKFTNKKGKTFILKKYHQPRKTKGSRYA